MSRLRDLGRIFTLRCEAASELASRERDEPLARLEGAAALRAHLIACRSCRRFRRQIGLIQTAVRLRDRTPAEPLSDDDALSDERRRRIASAVDEAGRNLL